MTDSSFDIDAQETREWMDALSAVIEAEGPERAHYLLEQLLEHAREKSIDMPFSATTGYVNILLHHQLLVKHLLQILIISQ
jgi:pyruvate dehydrogenase E1 component